MKILTMKMVQQKYIRQYQKVNAFYKRHKLKIVMTIPFIATHVYYFVILSLGEEKGFYTNISTLLFISLLLLVIYLIVIKIYSVVVKGIALLQDGQQVLSKNQKVTHDLLTRFNESMQTVSQHNATEKIIFENKLFEELTDIRLKSNLTDSRTIIILEKVEEIDGRRN